MRRERLARLVEKYYDAEEAVLDGKSVMLNGQSMTMENLSEIRKGRQEIESRLAQMSGAGSRSLYSLARFK
ncbi:primosomal replication protein PriB/PriC domain protein [Serratia ureilytica]|uniref:primosomal replication protein PriB/PriC domain protein n=1 Tax=Serratia ureilytica TaxID=300181 RepID=UPI003713560F